MGRLKSIIKLSAIIVMMLGMAKTSRAQNKAPSSPKSVAQTSRDLKKKQWQRQREAARATKKALKAHMQHQTKDVRKRMKKDAKIAKQHNDGA